MLAILPGKSGGEVEYAALRPALERDLLPLRRLREPGIDVHGGRIGNLGGQPAKLAYSEVPLHIHRRGRAGEALDLIEIGQGQLIEFSQ